MSVHRSQLLEKYEIKVGLKTLAKNHQTGRILCNCPLQKVRLGNWSGFILTAAANFCSYKDRSISKHLGKAWRLETGISGTNTLGPFSKQSGKAKRCDTRGKDDNHHYLAV